jgi:1A family penicillin-binding protein
MELLELKNKTAKIFKSRGTKIGIIVLAPLLVLALLVVNWAHLYAVGVLAEFSGSDALVAAFDRNTLVYGQNGDLITELHAEINRIPVDLERIPDHVQKAFVAIEDQRYYSHRGVDLKAILRAGLSYCQSGGRITEGASTITQQVMKLYFLTPEQSLQRKIKEAVLALEFEMRYSKESILELYLNRVYFGEGAYGIQSASRAYFDKDSKDLTLAEGALLAALIQAPSIYDPYVNPEKAMGRRNVVLDKMFQQGFISRAEMEEALKEQLLLKSGVRETRNNNYSYFIDQVIEEAIAAVGEEKVFRGGLQIHTTLEPEIQKKAEDVFQRPGLFPSEKVEAALALVENETGAIKALVGGRDYGIRRGFNRSTQLLRQPGSAFKPISVYAPAFELGYSPESIILDTPFKAGNYEPRNSGGGFYGPVSIRTAVKWSRNVAAVRLLNQIGVDRGYEFAKKLGFELVEEDRCLPLALGGLTRGVSPLQMAGAYAAFANRGIYTKPYTIRSIETAAGENLYRHPEGVAVMEASTAESIISVLRSAVESGTGYRAGIRGIDVAGKTGTTELPDTPVFRGLQGNKDAWFVGINPPFYNCNLDGL